MGIHLNPNAKRAALEWLDGDDLATVAKRYGVTTAAVCAWAKRFFPDVKRRRRLRRTVILRGLPLDHPLRQTPGVISLDGAEAQRVADALAELTPGAVDKLAADASLSEV